MDFLSFESVDLAEVLSRIPRKGRDRMQFGIIELDRQGTIIAYNMGEARITGRNPEDMIGKNFFSDIAPCTQTPEFLGRFKAGVAKGNLSARFDYLFDFKMDPIVVRVTMVTSIIDGETRVLLVIRALTDEERERAQKDHKRLREVEQSRHDRETKEIADRTLANQPVVAAPVKRADLEIVSTRAQVDLTTPSQWASPAPEKAPQLPRPRQLTVKLIDEIAFARTAFPFSEAMLERPRAAKAALDKAVAAGVPVYGMTSGFGPLVDESAPSDIAAHQRSLLHHLATGLGKPFSVVQTRAAMSARLQTLLQGYSGASDKVILLLKKLLDENITPVVPQLGTVGASGDLTPLAHMALAMLGEGDVVADRMQRSARSVLAERGIGVLNLESRDALALVNGCSFATAVAALNGARARRQLRWAMLQAALYSQVMCAHSESLAAVTTHVRPHLGQITLREELSRLHQGSQRLRKEAAVGVPPQDAYTLRCQIQMFGAVLDALEHHDVTVETELNSVSDNPIIDPVTGEIAHGGNFFGQHVGFVSDYLRIAIVQWAQWCERAMARLVDPARNGGLEPQLRGKPKQSGFMGAQVTATALLAELRSLSHAASTLGSTTNSDNQDIVTMATMAARHTAEALELLASLQAILMLALAQAIDLTTEPSQAPPYSPACMALHTQIRALVPMLKEDRSMSNDIATIASLISTRDPSGGAEVFMI
jgi:tyrosine ammonia-lyase